MTVSNTNPLTSTFEDTVTQSTQNQLGSRASSCARISGDRLVIALIIACEVATSGDGVDVGVEKSRRDGAA